MSRPSTGPAGPVEGQTSNPATSPGRSRALPWTAPRGIRYPGPMNAILFDLDDTLTDRARSLRAYAERFAGDFASALRISDPTVLATVFLEADGGGYRPKEEVAACVRAALPWADGTAVPTVTQLVAHWREVFPGCAQPTEGLLETLDTLDARGFPYGVVSNGGALQRAKAEVLGLIPRLRTLVISEEVGVRKPDPRIFALARAALGAAAQVWFVGDHPTNDVLGADAAGLVPVWLAGRRPWDGVPHPRRQIVRLPELLSLLPEC